MNTDDKLGKKAKIYARLIVVSFGLGVLVMSLGVPGTKSLKTTFIPVGGALPPQSGDPCQDVNGDWVQQEGAFSTHIKVLCWNGFYSFIRETQYSSAGGPTPPTSYDSGSGLFDPTVGRFYQTTINGTAHAYFTLSEDGTELVQSYFYPTQSPAPFTLTRP